MQSANNLKFLRLSKTLGLSEKVTFLSILYNLFSKCLKELNLKKKVISNAVMRLTCLFTINENLQNTSVVFTHLENTSVFNQIN